jgi:GMP synthase (glutamine-hydrolysing)
MPRAALVVQNDPDKSLGRLAEGLEAGGVELDVRSPERELPDIRAYAGLIVLPGLADPVDETPAVDRARAAIEAALAAGLPVLGLCLGAQLLVQALGGDVHRCEPELGFGEVTSAPAAAADPLLAGAPERFTTFHAHTYAFTPPAGAEILLRNDVCVQACRQGDAWAFQCHPEVSSAWVLGLAVGIRGGDGGLLPRTAGFFAANAISPEGLERDLEASEASMRAIAGGIAAGFAARLG